MRTCSPTDRFGGLDVPEYDADPLDDLVAHLALFADDAVVVFAAEWIIFRPNAEIDGAAKFKKFATYSKNEMQKILEGTQQIINGAAFIYAGSTFYSAFYGDGAIWSREYRLDLAV